jgi:hypothetical protein
VKLHCSPARRHTYFTDNLCARGALLPAISFFPWSDRLVWFVLDCCSLGPSGAGQTARMCIPALLRLPCIPFGGHGFFWRNSPASVRIRTVAM